MAARTSATTPKMVSSSMLKFWRAVEREIDLVHGADARHGESAAGLTQLLGDLG